MNWKTTISAKNSNRFELFDVLRGIALLAMTSFHFGWDLEMFALVEPGFASQPVMVWYARGIASSFLFLVGVSLVLAHGKYWNARGFWIRFAKVGGAALLITIATYFTTPDIYIFFGILHHIALASLLGLLFLNLHWMASLLAAIGVLMANLFLKSTFFDEPYLTWTGLNVTQPRSSDFVPIVPFFAAVLLGIALGKLILTSNWKPHWKTWLADLKFEGLIGRSLKFIGQHSLVYYLVHQPIMIAFLYGFLLLTR